jgi:hypothetical protein
MLSPADYENYGSDFIDLTKRAAVDAVGPELAQLRQQNVQLRQMAARSNTANIQAELDRAVPGWRERIYANPAFSTWLESPDDYNAATRSQLLRQAVAAGDSGRVVRIYQGFEREGHHAPTGHTRTPQSRQTGGNIYTRPQIAKLYEQRRLGGIPDARWGPLEADIVRAAGEGRIAGALGPDGTQISRLR